MSDWQAKSFADDRDDPRNDYAAHDAGCKCNDCDADRGDYLYHMQRDTEESEED